jgi:hypothetical protein
LRSPFCLSTKTWFIFVVCGRELLLSVDHDVFPAVGAAGMMLCLPPLYAEPGPDECLAGDIFCFRVISNCCVKFVASGRWHGCAGGTAGLYKNGDI